MADTKPEEKPVEAGTEVEETKAEATKDDEKKERTGIISDASVLPESDDPKEIVKQIEFYFADSNLRFDKFLYGLVGEENKWVDVALVAGFNRMRRFKSLENIKKALEDSELMELNDDKSKMRRKHAMVMLKDPKLVDKAIARSIYAKGFGTETKTTQFDLEKFFEGTGVKVNAVRLRRDDDKVFKGSVFVEFKTSEDMQKFLGLEEKPEWEGKKMTLIDPNAEENDSEDKELPTADKAAKEAENGIKYMSKQDFVDMKMKAIEEGKIKPKDYKRNDKFDAFKKDKDGGSRHSHQGGGGRGGRGGRGHHNGRGGGRRDHGGRNRSRSPRRDNRDWRERRDDDRKNGFNDRRGGRDNRGHGRDSKDASSGQQYRADGIPIVRATEDPAKNLKRAREDGEEGNEGKRNKIDGAAAQEAA
ncbi:hypothetical protein AA313_de0205420 [Arthrobotrys entomopaga]|nr:hypothetical protein AA313_de0205420 [Arthrobotrys entomopaga]